MSRLFYIKLVGERGFEPPTHWSQTSCATKLRYSPLDLLMHGINGVANGTRTHDNWNHNPGLYQLSYSHHKKQDEILRIKNNIVQHIF